MLSIFFINLAFAWGREKEDAESHDFFIYTSESGNKKGVELRNGQYGVGSEPTMFKLIYENNQFYIKPTKDEKSYLTLKSHGLTLTKQKKPWTITKNRNISDSTGNNHYQLKLDDICLSKRGNVLSGTSCAITDENQLFFFVAPRNGDEQNLKKILEKVVEVSLVKNNQMKAAKTDEGKEEVDVVHVFLKQAVKTETKSIFLQPAPDTKEIRLDLDRSAITPRVARKNMRHGRRRPRPRSASRRRRTRPARKQSKKAKYDTRKTPSVKADVKMEIPPEIVEDKLGEIADGESDMSDISSGDDMYDSQSAKENYNSDEYMPNKDDYEDDGWDDYPGQSGDDEMQYDKELPQRPEYDRRDNQRYAEGRLNRQPRSERDYRSKRKGYPREDKYRSKRSPRQRDYQDDDLDTRDPSFPANVLGDSLSGAKNYKLLKDFDYKDTGKEDDDEINGYFNRLKSSTSPKAQQSRYDQRGKRSRDDDMYDSPDIQQRGSMYDQRDNRGIQQRDDRYNRDGSSNMQFGGNRYGQDEFYDAQTGYGYSTKPPTDEEREWLRKRGLEVVEKVIVQGKVDGVPGNNLKNLNFQGQQNDAKFASKTVYETVTRHSMQGKESINSSTKNSLAQQPPSRIPPPPYNQPQNPYAQAQPGARPGINQGQRAPTQYK